jgi:hypothetical protein
MASKYPEVDQNQAFYELQVLYSKAPNQRKDPWKYKVWEWETRLLRPTLLFLSAFIPHGRYGRLWKTNNGSQIPSLKALASDAKRKNDVIAIHNDNSLEQHEKFWLEEKIMQESLDESMARALREHGRGTVYNFDGVTRCFS